MKRIIFIFNIFGMVALLLLASCYPEQEVAPVTDASKYPTVTIEPAGDYSTSTEGDVLVYNITVSAMVKHSVGFGVDLTEESLVEGEDYEVSGGTLAAYSLSTTISIHLLSDGWPEIGEAFVFTISSDADPFWNWQLNANSDRESGNSMVMNVNDPNALTVAMKWDDPEGITDFDMLVESETVDPVFEGSWSADGATGNNPEIDLSIRNDDPDGPYDGVYYVGVDPFDVPEGDIHFEVRVGYPDGSVDIFEGTFNIANTDNYVTDTFTAWGIPMYRLIKVTKNGNSYDVSFDFVE